MILTKIMLKINKTNRINVLESILMTIISILWYKVKFFRIYYCFLLRDYRKYEYFPLNNFVLYILIRNADYQKNPQKEYLGFSYDYKLLLDNEYV